MGVDYFHCSDCKEIYSDCGTMIYCCETCGTYYCEYCVTEEETADKYTLMLEGIYYEYEEEEDGYYLLIRCPKCDPFLHMTDKYELT